MVLWSARFSPRSGRRPESLGLPFGWSRPHMWSCSFGIPLPSKASLEYCPQYVVRSLGHVVEAPGYVVLSRELGRHGDAVEEVRKRVADRLD